MLAGRGDTKIEKEIFVPFSALHKRNDFSSSVVVNNYIETFGYLGIVHM